MKKLLIESNGEAGDFYRHTFYPLFSYISNRIPEISDAFYSIDDAIRTGFAWSFGPFENWDFIGIKKGIELVESEGYKVADWVKEITKAEPNIKDKEVIGTYASAMVRKMEKEFPTLAFSAQLERAKKPDDNSGARRIEL